MRKHRRHTAPIVLALALLAWLAGASCRKARTDRWASKPVLLEPGAALGALVDLPFATWKAPPPRPALNAHFRFAWPLEDLNVTSPYGFRMHPVVRRVLFHRGIDLAAPRGTPVLAAGPGIVEFAGQAPLTGNTVILAHPGSIQTLYAHMDELLVAEGMVVSQGAVVGLVGSTGRSTGPHLHLQVNVAGRSVNPEDVLGRSPAELKWYVKSVSRQPRAAAGAPPREEYHGQGVP